MAKGKLIVIEGTDCSGKQTQSDLLLSELRQRNIPIEKYCFPNYNSPTGKIIAGPYLGKEGYGEALFSEGASNVDPRVASLYFAADRRYNINHILDKLNTGTNVIVDRYVDSNFAHQGAKINDDFEREKMFRFLEVLEYDLLGLPKPDITIFLHMPAKTAKILQKSRKEKPDQHEADEQFLENSEKTYLSLCYRHNYIKISCVDEVGLRTIDDIHKEVLDNVLSRL